MKLVETELEQYQYTVRRPAHCTGTGLHSGKKVRLAIHPAPANSGIFFVRTDLPRQAIIPARFDLVGDTTLATTLSDGRNTISTVEHRWLP